MKRAEPDRQIHPEHSLSKEEADSSQIVERLGWTPRQRLDYLVDMLAFEDRARRARRLE